MSRDGSGYIISVGPVNGPKERVDDVKIVSFKFEDNESKVDKLTLGIDNHNLDQTSHPRWKTGNEIQFQYGYQGNVSAPRLARIMSKKGKNPLVIEAQSKEAQLNRIKLVRTFENVKRSDVAKQIAKSYGYSEIYDQEIEDTEVVLESIAQAAFTDLELLRDMANREGFQFYIDASGFHFHQRKLNQKPVRTFTYYIDQEGGDLIDFSIEDDKKAGKPGAVTVAGRDPLEAEDIKERADKETEAERPTLGPVTEIIDAETATTVDAAAVGADYGTAKETAQEHVAATTERSAAAALRSAAGTFMTQQLKNVKIKGTCVGDPQFEAKKIAMLEGIGPDIAGRYYANSVVHNLTDSYQMECVFSRDSKNGAGGAGLPAGGVENTKDAPAGGSADGGGAGGALSEVELINPETGTPTGTYAYVPGK